MRVADDERPVVAVTNQHTRAHIHAHMHTCTYAFDCGWSLSCHCAAEKRGSMHAHTHPNIHMRACTLTGDVLYWYTIL